MYKYPNIDKLLSRRTFLLSLGKGALFSSIFFRLVYLQLFKSDQYKVLAEKNRISLRLIPPLRGKILDRNNNIIALNKNSYNVLIEDSENISEIKFGYYFLRAAILTYVTKFSLKFDFEQPVYSKMIERNSNYQLNLLLFYRWFL